MTNAQSIKKIESERRSILKEIKKTRHLIKVTSKDKRNTLHQYEILTKQIENRKLLLSTIRKEINYNTELIERSENVIESLTSDLTVLKEEYKTLIRKAYRDKLTNNSTVFILSASSFNEAYQRWYYIKQYNAYRGKQANLILKTQSQLEKKVKALEERKSHKVALLEEQQSQITTLEKNKKVKNTLYQNLKGKEVGLKKQLKEKQKAARKLARALESIIAQEMEEDENSPKESIMDIANLTKAFNKKKRRLLWPVKGVVVGKFGKQAHPTLKNIIIQNNGIAISTDTNAPVKAIFDGIVAGTPFIPGYRNTIMIKHGAYYSVYSNLEEVDLKKGDIVKKGKVIGKVGENLITGASVFHFEIWRNKVRLNPQDWLKK